MQYRLRPLLIALFLCNACDNSVNQRSNRSTTRPADNPEPVPGYLDSTEESIRTKDGGEISIGSTTVRISPESAGQDTRFA